MVAPNLHAPEFYKGDLLKSLFRLTRVPSSLPVTTGRRGRFKDLLTPRSFTEELVTASIVLFTEAELQVTLPTSLTYTQLPTSSCCSRGGSGPWPC